MYACLKTDEILCTLKHISRSTTFVNEPIKSILRLLEYILILYDNLLQSCECIKTKKRIMKISWYISQADGIFKYICIYTYIYIYAYICVRAWIYPRARMYASCREMRQLTKRSLFSSLFSSKRMWSFQARRLLFVFIIEFAIAPSSISRHPVYIWLDTVETRLYRMLFDSTSDHSNSTGKMLRLFGRT